MVATRIERACVCIYSASSEGLHRSSPNELDTKMLQKGCREKIYVRHP